MKTIRPSMVLAKGRRGGLIRHRGEVTDVSTGRWETQAGLDENISVGKPANGRDTF